jgi:predicted ATPase/class 3 adenylate cyclase/DNA-binding SARP family transcriptional activator
MDVRRSHQPFEIRVLGPVVLRADGIELALGAPKVRGVLALLAVRAPSVVSVDELILATWGNDPPRSAAKAIQTYVSTLRRLVPVGAIKTQRDGYKLDAQPDAVDSIAFQEMLVTAHRLSPREPRQAARVLSDALGLWRGDALIDLVNHHVGQVEAARLHEMRRTAEEDRSESLLRSGDHLRLIADLTAAVGNEPYRERRWGQLMIALYRSGRQAEAIETYQRLRVMLDEELGLDPSAELSALEEAILLQKPELDWRSTESMDEISFASSDDYASPPEVLESPSGTFSPASILKDPARSLAIEASSLDEPGRLPSGVVTLCFTDVEASTPMLARLGSQAYQQLIELHRQLIREATRPYGGVEVRTEGDGMFFAFSSAREGVLASCEAQRALVRHSWPSGGDIRVRMGLHSGQATVTSDGDYVGLAVHQAARVTTTAHGGQVLVSSDVLTDLPDLEQVEFRDLGEFSLRGLEGPTRLYQLCHSDLPTSFPPPRAPSAGVHNLGAVRTSFVGREDELAALAQLLETASLVTIVGPGGIGKTRLATEAGLRMAGRYPGGVWLVSLAGVNDERLLLSTVASALGVADRAQRGLAEAVIDRLSGPATLLIVDNCEHVVEECAQLIDRWLEVCLELTVVATSRESLGLAAEHVLRLSSLSEAAAVSLLAQRAAQARWGFAVTAANSEAVSEICRQLDGMPLALELAAARLAAFSPAQVVDRLADTLGVLDGRRDRDARHRSLRAALDWSYQLLDGREQDVIRRLAVFRGGFDPEAAESVADAPWDVLSNLVAQSLVEVDPDIEDPRFRLLEPVRQYAWSLVNDAEREETQGRHAGWVVGLAKQAGRQVMLDPARWSERLEAEHPNIEAAVEWSLGRPSDESALRIAGSLGYYWFTSGHGEALGWVEQALNRSDQVPPRLRARALLAGAMLVQLRPVDRGSQRTGEHPPPAFVTSAAWAHEAGVIFRETGSRGSLAWALFWEAGALQQFDENSTRRSIAEALQIFRDLNDPLGVCWCLDFEGDFACRERRWVDAEALYTESLEFGRATGVEHAVGDALSHLGRLAGRSGNHRRAIELTGEAVALWRRGHDRWQLCVALSMFGFALYSAGDHEGAANALIESLDLAEAHGFYERLEWMFRDIALLLPDEFDDLARKLWTPVPATWEDQLWSDSKLAERRRRLASEWDGRRVTSQLPRATIPIAREALVHVAGKRSVTNPELPA